jgi:CheY-like chemotaxis protein
MAINREIAAGFLGFAGHHVVGADSGAAAIELASTADFDLILMDVLMPGMDGLEATRRIRALAPPRGLVPIVALSAQSFAEQIEKCLQAGMMGHISKPFEQANLVAVVERVAAQPVRREFADLPVGGQIPEAQDEDALFDRAAMVKISTMILQENVINQFESLIVLGEALLESLRGIEDEGRRTKLADDAHRLGGTLGMFGFKRLATSVRRFEAAVEQNATDVVDKRDVLATALKEAIDIMRQEILVASGPSVHD